LLKRPGVHSLLPEVHLPLVKTTVCCCRCIQGRPPGLPQAACHSPLGSQSCQPSQLNRSSQHPAQQVLTCNSATNTLATSRMVLAGQAAWWTIVAGTPKALPATRSTASACLFRSFRVQSGRASKVKRCSSSSTVSMDWVSAVSKECPEYSLRSSKSDECVLMLSGYSNW